MIRPLLADQEESRQRLVGAMFETDYPYAEEHEKIIDYAIVFEGMDGDDIAGYVWFYRMAENESVWAIHLMVFDGYKGRFFRRSVVNSFFGAMYSLGCDIVRAENWHQDLLLRVGGKQNSEFVDLKLPHIWR